LASEGRGGTAVAFNTATWPLGIGMTATPDEEAQHAVESVADRAFIEELFARHHGEIYAYIYRMVRESELAADFAQDTFIKAYRHLDSLEDRAKARAWLYQIAHRVVLDELRRRRIVRFLPWTGESHGAAPSAEHLAMEMRLSGPLARALARIPERQRAALLMAEVNDMTGLELAEALGVSHVAARALLTRARESLRQALADERREEKEREAALDATYAARTGGDPRHAAKRDSDDSQGIER
jgi:RNA polymerase sigma-70 factor (ECF subfamily)